MRDNMVWYKDAVGGLWDVIGPLQCKFLVEQGLKPEHYVLDVGCGSLRGGIHCIDYLDDKHYFGIDKDTQLITMGVEYEMKKRQILKAPILRVMEDFDFDALHQKFDFAIAQSVFTHLPWNSILRCLVNIQKVLTPNGKFFATFFENDHPEKGMHLQPIIQSEEITTHMDRDPFHYEFDVFHDLAKRSGLMVKYIGAWKHPRNQKMMLFMKKRQIQRIDQ